VIFGSRFAEKSTVESHLLNEALMPGDLCFGYPVNGVSELNRCIRQLRCERREFREKSIVLIYKLSNAGGVCNLFPSQFDQSGCDPKYLFLHGR
jgi:hypothetical protein